MKEAGWKEGMGLGARNSGIPTAIGKIRTNYSSIRWVTFLSLSYY